MAWIIPENKLDTQQRDFLDNVDIDKESSKFAARNLNRV